MQISAPKCLLLLVLAGGREARRIGEGRALEKVAATLEPIKSEPGGSKRDRSRRSQSEPPATSKRCFCWSRAAATRKFLNSSPPTVKHHLRTLFLRAGIRDGRKRVKLAIAMFAKEEARSCPPQEYLTPGKFRSLCWSGKA
jgi:hypothetical protein